jgi:peptidyl-prolyl cis-trans isomerase B (cyclophilin B)
VIATTSVACFVIAMGAVASSAPSFASDSKTPRPSQSASASPLLSKQMAPKKQMAPFSSNAAPVSACAKTTSTAHYPIKVGTPDTKVTPTDHTFTLNTNCGTITFTAFGKKAPVTVIAMTYLAKAGFFDHSLCHRITTAGLYVLQCGDPTATGSGGPMWSYNDENLPVKGTNDYPAGTIAMANSGIDPQGRGTNGSQFFIVYKDTTLGADYTIWGQVTSGLDVVKKVAAAGVVGGGTDGTPKQVIAIESVKVSN